MADKSSSETPQSARSAPSGTGAAPAAGGQAAQNQSRQGATDQRAGRGSGSLQRRSLSPLFGAVGLSPFSLMRRMMEDMDQMLDVFGSGRALGGGPQRQGGGALSAVWSPAIEVLERDGALVVRADLPGMSPDDVRIEVTDDSLVIEGERRQEIEVEEEGGVYRSERFYGRFSRVIPLPDGANAENAQARFENGVLEISIPLAEDAGRGRRIPIQGGAQSGGGQTGPKQDGGGSAVH